MWRTIPLTRLAAVGALLWLPAMAAQASGFERIEAQCQARDGTTAAARLLPDGSISRLDGSALARVSPADAAGFSRDLDRIGFDRLPSDIGMLAKTRDYCLLARADGHDTHVVWIDPVAASGQRRAALGVVTRLLDLAE